MADVALEWNGDFEVSPQGGLVLVDGDELARQRIIRRLFTAVQGYVWHPEYGAGLPQRIGNVARQRRIESIVRSQIALEASVAASPPPRVTVTDNSSLDPGLYQIKIEYTDTATKLQMTLTFTV
jgi:hypothetical protein